MRAQTLPQLALRHWLFWVVDMTVAITGWVYGFGLEVQNWWALIGVMLFGRWVSFVMFRSHDHEIARRQVLREIEEKGGAE